MVSQPVEKVRLHVFGDRVLRKTLNLKEINDEEVATSVLTVGPWDCSAPRDNHKFHDTRVIHRSVFQTQQHNSPLLKLPQFQL